MLQAYLWIMEINWPSFASEGRNRMPRFTANLSVLFTDLPFLDRFEAARNAGFAAVEIAFPYEYCLFTTKRKLRDTGLELALINLPTGNVRLGERGIAANPSRQAEFRAGVEVGIRWARELGVRRVNCLAGVRQEEYSFKQQIDVLIQNCAYAAEQLVKHGISLTIDAGSFCRETDRLLECYESAALVKEQVEAGNVSLLFQLCPMPAKKDISMLLRQYIRQIGFLRINGECCPRRKAEVPNSLAPMLRELDALGYSGYVSLEGGFEAGVLSIADNDRHWLTS